METLKKLSTSSSNTEKQTEDVSKNDRRPTMRGITRKKSKILDGDSKIGVVELNKNGRGSSKYIGVTRNSFGYWQGQGRVNGRSLGLARAPTEKECAYLTRLKVAELRAAGNHVSNDYGFARREVTRNTM